MSSAPRRPLVVVISGVSRSGKSTVIEGMADHCCGGVVRKRKVPGPAICHDGQNKAVISIHGDDYFNTEVIAEQLGGNWDHPDAVNHRAILETLTRQMNVPGVDMIIFEGFMAFHDDEIMRRADVLIWLDVPYDVSRERRFETNGTPYEQFDRLIWPNHVAYEKRVFDPARLMRFNKNIQRIDSTQPKDRVLKLALSNPAFGAPAGAALPFQPPAMQPQLPQALPVKVATPMYATVKRSDDVTNTMLRKYATFERSDHVWVPSRTFVGNGEKVEVICRHETGELFSYVRTKGGVEGWIQSKFLIPSAATQPSQPAGNPNAAPVWKHYPNQNCYDGFGGSNVDLQRADEHPEYMSVDDAKRKCVENNLAGFTYEPHATRVWFLATVYNPSEFAKGEFHSYFDVYVCAL